MAKKPVNEQEAIALYESGMTFHQLGERYGVDPSTLRKRLVKAGIRSHPKGWATPEGTQARRVATAKTHSGKTVSQESRARSSATKRARAVSARGTRITVDGYVAFSRRDSLRDKKVHRVVMEEHLGRKLERSEHVHHIDGDKTNNDLSNLRLMSGSEHMALHTHNCRRDDKGRIVTKRPAKGSGFMLQLPALERR